MKSNPVGTCALVLCLAFSAAGISCTAASPAANAAAAAPDALRVDPKVFGMMECWLSDTESPVVTEINLDAVAKNRNQFDAPVAAHGWFVSKDADGGTRRYRVIGTQGARHQIEYQSSGGGSLATSTVFEVEVADREIRKDGKTAHVRVLRLVGLSARP